MRLTSRLFVALCALILGAPTLHADDPPELPLGKRLEEYGKLEQELQTLFKAKEYDKAADVCRKQMLLVPESGEPHYNLACAMARLGHKDQALFELGEAIERGFTDAAHMRADDDLATLRDEQSFKDLLKKARDKELNAPHEMPAEIPGVKTIEAFPEQGLRYRLRIDPGASAQKPARLLIWLHPSGGSMDNVVEQMAPQFAKDGYAVLVFTQKDYNGWTGTDAAAMMEKTLPDVAKIPGVDAKKPILLGFSAGGQLALQLWEKDPAAFGGLVLDAAYPIDPTAFGRGQIVPLTIPKNDAVAKCPVFALVGGNDAGSKLWSIIAKSWHEAHIPLTLHIVPGKKHEWLIDKTEGAALHGWLKRVAAGELPNEAEQAPPTPKVPDKIGPSIKVIHPEAAPRQHTAPADARV